MKKTFLGLVVLLFSIAACSPTIFLPIAKWQGVYCDQKGCLEGSSERILSGYIYEGNEKDCSPTITDFLWFVATRGIQQVYYLKENTCQVWDLPVTK